MKAGKYPSAHRLAQALSHGSLAAALLLLATAALAQVAPERPDASRHRDAREARGSAPSWTDNAHGHAQRYPRAGVRLPALPRHTPLIPWSGGHYGFHAGTWYSPADRGGYVVVRPPFGIVVPDLPALRTLVVVGGISYLYLNGVYYRDHSSGGYEVVANPAAGTGSKPLCATAQRWHSYSSVACVSAFWPWLGYTNSRPGVPLAEPKPAAGLATTS